MNLLYNFFFKSLYKPCPTRTNMDLHESLINTLINSYYKPYPIWTNMYLHELYFTVSNPRANRNHVQQGPTLTHMANIHQEQLSIRNMQVVSSNRVHSTHSCEANKCRIFKPFFLFIR